jgi:hypothetical protein
MSICSLAHIPWGALAIVALGCLAYRITFVWYFNLYLFVLILIYFAFRFNRRKRKSDVAWFVLSLIAVAFLHYSELTPHKKFYRFYEAIYPGMDKETLNKLESSTFPRDGKWMALIRHSSTPPLVQVPSRSYRMDTRITGGTDDVIFLKFQNDKVIHKEFIAD